MAQRNFFPTWRIRFEDQEVFNDAVHKCAADDIGWSDKTLAFFSAEKMERAKARLVANGTVLFTTENPD